jgi:hypothetical protein
MVIYLMLEVIILFLVDVVIIPPFLGFVPYPFETLVKAVAGTLAIKSNRYFIKRH